MGSPLLIVHDGMTRAEVCSEIYRSLDYLLEGPDPVNGAAQLVYPPQACRATGFWGLNGMEMANLVPTPIWDKAVRLSGLEMLHSKRTTRPVPSASITVDSAPSARHDDMSVLDPTLRDSPMHDSFSSQFTLDTDDERLPRQAHPN